VNTTTLSIELKPQKKRFNKNLIYIKSKINPETKEFWFFPGVLSASNDLLSLWEAFSRIKTLNPDLIHVLNVNKEVYSIIHRIIRIKQPVLLHFFHSPYVLKDDVFRIRNLAFKVGFYNNPNIHILTVNRSSYQFFIKELGLYRSQVHYLPFPIDIQEFKPLNNKEKLREKNNLSTERPTVVYVGSLNPARGIINLVRSIAHCIDKIPNILLYISHPQRKGEEVYEKKIYRLIHDLQLQKNVLIRGPSKNIIELYNLADVLVFPFKRPYWVDPPLVLLEAMACAAPIITTPAGAIQDVIKDNYNALFTEIKPHSIAQKIMVLLEHPQESLNLGKKARNTIIEEYSYETVGNRISKIYNSILNN
jgi:glycosyltransferase involved in cell wall biosynthesis